MPLEIGPFNDQTAYTEEEARAVRENNFCNLGLAAVRAMNRIARNNAGVKPEEDGNSKQDTKDSQKTE